MVAVPSLRDQLHDARYQLARAHTMGAHRAVTVLEEQIAYLEQQIADTGQGVEGWG